jgi:hypothetical protein
MKLQDMYTEVDATDAAHKMGLQSIGFGRWADKTGKVVAKTIKGKLQPIKPEQPKVVDKSDTPARAKPALPIHRDFGTKKVKPNAGIPNNREELPAHADHDPTQTLQPTANPPKRVEPQVGKISDDERRAAGDYVPADDPSVNPDRKPKYDGGGNLVKPDGGQSDAKKQFKPLVKGADGKWGTGEPAKPKISSAARAAAGDYNADDDKTLDRNKGGEESPNPTPWRPKEKDGGQSDAMKNFKPLKRGVDFDNDPKQSDAMKNFKGIPKKKKNEMKLGEALKTECEECGCEEEMCECGNEAIDVT